MRRTVLVTEAAERDLGDVYQFIAETDSLAHAEYVLGRLLEVAENLAELPERGAIPAELRALGSADFRQVFFKPYRAIYRVHEDRVIIYLIADGQPDMQAFLARRLLAT